MTSIITFKQLTHAEAGVGGTGIRAFLVHERGERVLPRNVAENALQAAVDATTQYDSAGQASMELVRASSLPAEWSYTIVFSNPEGDVAVYRNLKIPDHDARFDQVLEQVSAGAAPEYSLITQGELNDLLGSAGIRSYVESPLTGTGIQTRPLGIADIPREKLDRLLRETIDGSVAYDGVDTDGAGTLNVTNNEGTRKGLQIGVSGERARRALEGLGAGDRLNIDTGTQGNLPASRVTGLPSGGNQGPAEVTQAELDAVEDKADANAAEVARLKALDDALHSPTTIAAGQVWVQAGSNAATRLPANPLVPGAQDDARLTFAVTGAAEATGGIDLNEFRAISTAAQSAQLDTSNAFSFSGGGTTFHVARESGSNRFLVSAASIGRYSITITLDQVEIKDGQLETPPYTDAQADARANARIDAVIPASTRAPVPKSGDGGKVLAVNTDENGLEYTDAEAGVDSAAVNTLIDARIPVARRVPASAGSADASKVLKLDSAGANPAWREDAEGSGGGGGTAVPWRITEVRRTESPTDLRTPAGTGTIGTGWTAEQTLLSYTVPSDSGGGLIAFVHARAVSPAGVQGGDRIYVRLNLYRIRGSVTTSLTDKTYYVRNSGQLSATANAASRRGDITFAIPLNVQTGDVIRARVQAIAQVAGRNSVTWARASNDMMILRPPSGVAMQGGGGGLTTSQVNDLINAALPAAQRPPALSTGAALQHLRINAAGTGLEYVAAPAGLTQAQVDARIRAVAPGLAVTAANAQIVSRVEEFAQDGNGARIPEGKLPQKLDDLMDATDLKGWTDAGANPQGDVWISQSVYVTQRPASPQTAVYVRNRDDVTPAVANRYVLVRVPDSAPESPGDDLRLNVGVRGELDVASASADWTFLSRVGSNRYYSALVTRAPAEADFRCQYYLPFRLDPARVNSVPTDGTDGEYLERVSGRPQWRGIRQVPDGGSEGQQIRADADGAAEWFTPPVPPHTESLQDGAGAGISVTASGVSAQRTAFTGFTTTFDLDDSDHRNGELDFEFTITLSQLSRSDVGIDDSGGNTKTARITDIMFASELRALGDYAVSDSATRIRVGRNLPVFAGTQRIGVVNVVIGHDSANRLGYVVGYFGSQSGFTFAVGVSVRALWSPTDAASGGLGQSQVDARVRALVEDWAEAGNAGAIPLSKLGNAPQPRSNAYIDGRANARVNALVQNWARDGTTAIPAGKLTNAPSGGLSQSQVDARARAIVADWAEQGNAGAIPVGKLSNAPQPRTPAYIDGRANNRIGALVQNWARDATTAIPAGKLTNAGGLNQGAVDARVRAGVADWAEVGNTDDIPASKIPEVPAWRQIVGTTTNLAGTGVSGNFAMSSTNFTTWQLVGSGFVIPESGLLMFASANRSAIVACDWLRSIPVAVVGQAPGTFNFLAQRGEFQFGRDATRRCLVRNYRSGADVALRVYYAP